MNLLSRYNIKYNLDGGMDEYLVTKYINQITKIYHMVNKKYNGYMTDKKDTIILSGYASILYYLYSLGYKDLIINESFQSPTDVNLLMVYYTEMKPVIDEFYIEDFKQITKNLNGTNITFKNNWTNDEIKDFDLTLVPFYRTRWNDINGINVLNLTELKAFYDQVKDLDKIEIIKKILERLELSPRPDIIKQGIRVIYKPTNKLLINQDNSMLSESSIIYRSFDKFKDN